MLFSDREKLVAQLKDKGTLLPVVYGAVESTNQLSRGLAKKLRTINEEAEINSENAGDERIDKVRLELLVFCLNLSTPDSVTKGNGVL